MLSVWFFTKFSPSQCPRKLLQGLKALLLLSFNIWAAVDSNHRPHPYQGCALTTWASSPQTYMLFSKSRTFDFYQTSWKTILNRSQWQNIFLSCLTARKIGWRVQLNERRLVFIFQAKTLNLHFGKCSGCAFRQHFVCPQNLIYYKHFLKSSIFSRDLYSTFRKYYKKHVILRALARRIFLRFQGIFRLRTCDKRVRLTPFTLCSCGSRWHHWFYVILRALARRIPLRFKGILACCSGWRCFEIFCGISYISLFLFSGFYSL